MIKLYKGDCLIESDKIESGSVDLILTDLPYGTVKGLGNSRVAKEKNYNVSEWDVTIDTKKIFEIANRILRKNGKMILTAQQPFTTELISKAIPNLPHCYNMIWEKDHFANALLSNKAPVNYYEDILVFSKPYKKYDLKGNHPLRGYFKSVLDFIGVNLKQINKTLGYRRAEHTFYVTPKKAVIGEVGQKADHCTRFGSSQFSLCTENTYLELIEVFNIKGMEGFKEFSELKEIDTRFKDELIKELGKEAYPTFNLWEGKKYKSNILKYKKDYSRHHPTQKPVLLLEDLIKTFSNVGDLVVDLTMGSGSTMVACENTMRNGIGIEMNDEYFETAKIRLDYQEQ